MKKKMFRLAIPLVALLAASGPFPSYAAEKEEMPYTTKIGSFSLTTLPDGHSERPLSILRDVPTDIAAKYAPNGTFPMAVNAFLLQTPKNTVLIDTAFGKNLFILLKDQSVAADTVDTIILTHMHGDHISGLLTEGQPAFPQARLFIAEKEYAYWTDATKRDALPEDKRGGFNLVKTVLDAYEGRITYFDPGIDFDHGTEIVPGVWAVAAYGHTPGHTAFLLADGEEKLLMWADLAHSMAIQIPAPAVSIMFDVDPKEAAITRQKILAEVADRKINVAGSHIPWPGMGHITGDAKTGYTLTPLK